MPVVETLETDCGSGHGISREVRDSCLGLWHTSTEALAGLLGLVLCSANRHHVAPLGRQTPQELPADAAICTCDQSHTA